MGIVKQFWQRFQQSSFYVKWTNWEYYPVYIANIPTVFFWLYFGIRSRSLFYFSAVNPVIETGGVMGESKINIFNRLPAETIPTTILIPKAEKNIDTILEKINKANIVFPLIAKPDVGERGFLVEKIENSAALAGYLKKISVDFIIQDFINYPLEVSILYHRFPDATEGKITSICIKKTLSVTGDGVSTIEKLMEEYPRARFQLERFRKDYSDLLIKVPTLGAQVELEPIGNHCRGTTFLNGNKYIDKTLEKVFDKIALKMEGIHYGRFDMKCESIALLKQGKQFKVLEFNGIASEPAHIYDPEYGTLQAYRDIFSHWKIIYNLSKIQQKKGVAAMSWKEAFQSVRSYLAYMKGAKKNGLQGN